MSDDLPVGTGGGLASTLLPTSGIPTAVAIKSNMTMADALPSAGAEDDDDDSAFDVIEKLMNLSKLSENRALQLAEELHLSLAPPSPQDGTTSSIKRHSSAGGGSNSGNRRSNLLKRSSRDGVGGSTTTSRGSVTIMEESKDDDIMKQTSSSNNIPHFPIPLPLSLQPMKHTKHSSTSNSSDDNKTTIFTIPMACAESIQHSLGKIAVTGSKASSELRSLENERQNVDQHASDLAAALTLRQLSNQMVQTFNEGRLRDCVYAIANYRSVNPTPRALALVGSNAIDTYTDMEVKLTMEMLRRYEIAAKQTDIQALSDLTPLLGMLSLAHKGVGLYLQYTQTCLEKIVQEATYMQPVVQTQQHPQRERGQYPTPEQMQQVVQPLEPPKPNIPMQLAKIYNGAVTHLRHHLPMVVSSLGEADGDVALIRLVSQFIGENHATRLLKQFRDMKHMPNTSTKSELVVNAIMERYVGGGNNGAAAMEYQEDVLTNPTLAIATVTGGVLSDEYHDGMMNVTNDPRYDDPELLEDCGFHTTLGTLGSLDTFLDDCALCLQHTESYERFIKHASEEVGRARDYRIEQEKLKEQQETKEKDTNDGTSIANTNEQKPNKDGSKKKVATTDKQEKESLEPILPATSQLDEICSELGGHYSGIEHCLLLGAMQRAFAKTFHTTRPSDVERLFQPVGILDSISKNYALDDDHNNVTGINALQTCLVEECFYASQRSTLRAFATGHAGTACAAANFCSDAIGRALLQVVIRKTEMSIVALRPGEGLLVGQGGFSQMTMNALRNVNALTQRTKSNIGQRGKGGGGGIHDKSMAEEAMEQLMQYRIRVGIARACASFNDVEVAKEYVKRLEGQLLQEVESSFIPGLPMTEQITMCVRSLGPIVDSYNDASNEAIEQLLNQILPRVRSIVNDAVGQENAAATAFSNLASGAVAAASGGATSGSNASSLHHYQIRMNYDMAEDAYEIAQVTEGYMERLCNNLDELLEPLRAHLLPNLSDQLVLGILRGASKRLEMALRRTQCTALGALCLDSDFRNLLNFAKERLSSVEYTSKTGLLKACVPLARLGQISALLNVDDTDDVLDLMSSMKRKGNWDLKKEDCKTFLSLRVEFDNDKISEVLRITEME